MAPKSPTIVFCCPKIGSFSSSTAKKRAAQNIYYIRAGLWGPGICTRMYFRLSYNNWLVWPYAENKCILSYEKMCCLTRRLYQLSSCKNKMILVDFIYAFDLPFCLRVYTV